MASPHAAYQPGAPSARPGELRQFLGAALSLIDAVFGAISLALLLAVVVTVPIVGFIALGYMLRAASDLVRSGKLRSAFVGVRQASRLGQIALGTWLWTLPARLFISLHTDATLIHAGSKPSVAMLRTGQVFVGIAIAMVVLALAQGGKLIHFVRPIRGARALRAAVVDPGGPRWPQSIRALFTPFRVGHSWWLGLRCYLTAGAWLLIPTGLMALSGREGPVLVVGAVLLTWAVMYVPFLQLHVAVHDDLRRAVGVRDIRYLFWRAPFAFAAALLVTLAFALPLYLLKIEIVPRDALWLPSLVFVVTIFPTKIATALAYRRAARREAPCSSLAGWCARVVMVAVAVVYTVVVFLTPSIGWHGVPGMFEHHAFLLPVPF